MSAFAWLIRRERRRIAAEGLRLLGEMVGAAFVASAFFYLWCIL